MEIKKSKYGRFSKKKRRKVEPPRGVATLEQLANGAEKSDPAEMLKIHNKILADCDNQLYYFKTVRYAPKKRSYNNKFNGPKFLEVYAKTRSFAAAVQAVGCARSTAREHLNGDPEFRKKFTDLEELHVDALEAAALQRATEGTRKPVFHKGQAVGTVREMSDTLAIFILKNLRPYKYFVDHFEKPNAVEDTAMKIVTFVKNARATLNGNGATESSKVIDVEPIKNED